MISIQNQSVESVHRALGLQPPPPFPTYSHPYHSTPASPTRAPIPSVSAPFTRTEPDICPPVIPSSLTTRTISTEQLAASLSRALDPTVSAPSFSAVVELVADIATSSGSQPAVTVATSEPVPVDSSSEEETDETIVADEAAHVVVTTTVPTTLVEPVPTPAETQTSIAEDVTTSAELPLPAEAPGSASPSTATETAPDSSQA